jgi:hypothetical protein
MIDRETFAYLTLDLRFMPQIRPKRPSAAPASALARACGLGAPARMFAVAKAF